MTKFFLPLIILLIVAWLIIGLQQEYNTHNNKEVSDHKDSATIVSNPSYSDSLNIQKYSGYYLVTAKNLNFLIPSSLQLTYDLTDESDAYLQYYRSQPALNCIIYVDEFSTDTADYNYSLKSYIRSAINTSRKNLLEFNMKDSITFNLPTGQQAVLVSFDRIRLLDDSSKSTRSVTFLTTNDDYYLYMIYFYCDTADYKTNLDDIRKVYTSTAIVKY